MSDTVATSEDADKELAKEAVLEETGTEELGAGNVASTGASEANTAQDKEPPAPDTSPASQTPDKLSASAVDLPLVKPRKEKKRSRFISRRIDDVMILAAIGAFVTLALAFATLRGGDEAAPSSVLKPVALLNTSDQAYTAYQKGDFVTARTLWRGAASKGDLSAQYNLGLIYAEGRGVVRNPEAAMEWWRLAADRGHAGAQHNLALALVSGETLTPGRWTPSNMDDAEGLLRDAIASGFVAAEYSLGTLLLLETEEQEEARKLLRSASDKGSNAARFALASAYLQDKVHVGDKREALVLFLQAASSGYGQAQLELANLYALGKDVQKNEIEALAWATVAMKNRERGAGALRSKLLDALSDEEVAIAHRRIEDLAQG